MKYVLMLLMGPMLVQGVEITPDRLSRYKSVDGIELRLHVFEPEGLHASDHRPAIIFFFGGGWAGGTPRQFYPQARAMAGLGMVAFSADYRVRSRHLTTPAECVKDGKSAIRWVREHAAELGVDPTRIVASGGSAGGHVAACAGLVEGYDEEGEALGISSVPNAMILFNPVLDTTPETGFAPDRFTPEQQMDLSPCHQVKRGAVPTLVLHGTKDTTVPFEQATRFARLMNEAGNDCTLVPFEGRGHGFFNGSTFRPANGDADYQETMRHSIAFLAANGCLDIPDRPGALKPYDGSREALQTMPVPAWCDDGKIGILIHWGPYRVTGYRKEGKGYAEQIPQIIDQDPEPYCADMKERWGAHPPEFGYKDIIPEFTAENWSPDEWAVLYKEAGAHYVVLTAEHHDGWANWGSDLAPWNAVDRGLKRDLVGDLGKAVRMQELKYASSFHRERHTGFFGTRESMFQVYSEPSADVVAEIERVPDAASLYGPFGMDEAFVDDYVARWKGIQRKYYPDFLWIDDVPVFTRNGHVLIHIGPRGDGPIPVWQVERLRAMGEWLKTNGDAMCGTRYWKADSQEDEHLPFTTNHQTLYAVKRGESTAPFIIHARAGWREDQVESVRLLGSLAPVNW